MAKAGTHLHVTKPERIIRGKTVPFMLQLLENGQA